MSAVAVFDLNGAAVANCSLSRAIALLEKGAAEVIRMEPMAIKLVRPAGNGTLPSAPRSRDTANPSQKKGAARLKSLRARDGDNCFYCGVALGTGDVTLEHLLSEKDGGSWRLANLVLAHKSCNELAADLPVVAKVLLRERLHARRIATLSNGMP